MPRSAIVISRRPPRIVHMPARSLFADVEVGETIVITYDPPARTMCTWCRRVAAAPHARLCDDCGFASAFAVDFGGI